MSKPVVPTQTLRRAADLAAAGLIAPGHVEAVERVAALYSVAVTPSLVALMNRADPNDPIARQFVPSAAELMTAPEERRDPIGDETHSPVRGIVHRYPDRVLLTPLLVCPVYCRFCFRRARVGDADGTLSEAELDAALAYVAARPDLREVIVTGGDPLMLPPGRIKALVDRVGAIPHVEVLRFHSRVPVADPERVTDELAKALRREAGSDLALWLAVHVNHPRELSAATRAALARLADAGLPLLSQTVLLKGVNDSPEILEDLMRALVRNRVRPYYLHHPDLAPGTSHFRPSIAEGQALMRALRGRLSGIAQPTYVLDIPGGAGKVPIGPGYWNEEAGSVSDPVGRSHDYRGAASRPVPDQ
ncbi:lysine-2,3-aminomutase-like protein [Paramagnetospirillum kuznetsovii]|uniref:Lysine-2,3-aminomutase-like protein n=1 Tax=Paramagnetospirillum kuznetsovii TaxID=2053833 RepID=A0A364NTM3_9PROT|nr:lysine-2,3-aminomutase-like protein [Paramagnetospirillum kuznetsovii]RAU20416.1 lysine-2,3-aminomutase-like protein [Paramagnetospirillum kuznetsovii]